MQSCVRCSCIFLYDEIYLKRSWLVSFCGEMIFCILLGNFKIHKEDRSAKKNFSELPTNGRGVRKNRQLALKYLHKSAELGSPKARKILKKMESSE